MGRHEGIWNSRTRERGGLGRKIVGGGRRALTLMAAAVADELDSDMDERGRVGGFLRPNQYIDAEGESST